MIVDDYYSIALLGLFTYMDWPISPTWLHKKVALSLKNLYNSCKFVKLPQTESSGTSGHSLLKLFPIYIAEKFSGLNWPKGLSFPGIL